MGTSGAEIGAAFGGNKVNTKVFSWYSADSLNSFSLLFITQSTGW